MTTTMPEYDTHPKRKRAREESVYVVSPVPRDTDLSPSPRPLYAIHWSFGLGHVMHSVVFNSPVVTARNFRAKIKDHATRLSGPMAIVLINVEKPDQVYGDDDILSNGMAVRVCLERDRSVCVKKE